jgi:hypothetical protein
MVAVTNTLAYYDTKIITTVKSFILQTPDGENETNRQESLTKREGSVRLTSLY